MALVKCPECGKEISQEAFACPACGKPLRNPLRVVGKGFLKYAIVTWVLLIIAFLAAFSLLAKRPDTTKRGADRGSSVPERRPSE
jgi:hypothetical protein